MWSAGSGLGFDEGNETRNCVAAFEQSGDLLDFFHVEGALDDRGQKMKRLASQKIHGAHRFQEDRRRRRHATFYNDIGDTLHQFDIVNGEGLGIGLDGERMAETGSQLNQLFSHANLGWKTHKCLSDKGNHQRAALYEGVGGESIQWWKREPYVPSSPCSFEAFVILRNMQPKESCDDSDIDQRIRHVMVRHPSVVLAILFGSIAKNYGRSDSDLDIAIATSTPLTAQTHIAIIEDLALAFGRPVDLIDLGQTHNPLLQQILTKGRRVLCHDRTRYAELLLRMVYEEADCMPYYRRILSDRRRAWTGI